MAKNSILYGVLALCAAIAVNAHAGHFHRWPDTPAGRNYIRQNIGAVIAWTTLNTTAYGDVIVRGGVNVTTYLYKNCTDIPSTALEFDLVLSDSQGRPLNNVTTQGQVFIGACENPFDAYYQEPSLGDESANMLWWGTFTTAAGGVFRGAAANGFVARGVDSNGTVEPYLTRSVIIATRTTGPLLCGDIQLLPRPPPEWYTSQGEFCETVFPPPPAPSAPPCNGSSSSSSPTSGHDDGHSDHDHDGGSPMQSSMPPGPMGHDMGGDDHHDHDHGRRALSDKARGAMRGSGARKGPGSTGGTGKKERNGQRSKGMKARGGKRSRQKGGDSKKHRAAVV